MHTSFLASDHLGELLKFKDPAIRLHRTKVTALCKNVIGLAIERDLKTRLEDVPFSILIDESTDLTAKKFLAIFVR